MLNGAQGLNAPAPSIFGVELKEPAQYLVLCVTVVVLTTLVAHNVSRSRAGRAFAATRDNDLAAEPLGVNAFAYKLQAFFLASVFAGLAGVLQAHNLRHTNSETVGLVASIMFLGMLVVGGPGTNLGPIFGAIVVTWLLDRRPRSDRSSSTFSRTRRPGPAPRRVRSSLGSR